jgi:prepilin-type processing-associated H-X9-DG protein
VFPPAYQTADPRANGTLHGVAYGDSNRNGPPGWAWGALILPYLEQANVQNAFDLKQACWAPSNLATARTKLTIFLCPSATGGSEGFVMRRYTSGDHETPLNPQPYSPSVTFAHSHYVTMAGTQGYWARPAAYSFDFTVGEPVSGVGTIHIDGVFYRNSKTRIADISDGTSSTVFLGEHSSSLSNKTWVGVIPYSVTCKKFNGVETTDCDSGGALGSAHSGPDAHDHPDVIIHQPNHPSRHADQLWADHPGGCNVLFGDGSVRFLTATMNPFTWRNMCTRNGGEVVPGDN